MTVTDRQTVSSHKHTHARTHARTHTHTHTPHTEIKPKTVRAIEIKLKQNSFKTVSKLL